MGQTTPSSKRLHARLQSYVKQITYYAKKIDWLEMNRVAIVGLTFIGAFIVASFICSKIVVEQVAPQGREALWDCIYLGTFYGLLVSLGLTIATALVIRLILRIYQRRHDAIVDQKVSLENYYYDHIGKFPSTYSNHQRFFKR